MTECCRDLRTLTAEVLAEHSARPAQQCTAPALRLEADLGIDSLALAEIVETLQIRLGILVPDEATGRIRTTGDLVTTLNDLLPPSDHQHEPPPERRHR